LGEGRGGFGPAYEKLMTSGTRKIIGHGGGGKKRLIIRWAHLMSSEGESKLDRQNSGEAPKGASISGGGGVQSVS